MRYFIEFAYHGKNYFGYQIQPGQITVQEVFEKALSTILRSDIKITGAGRTDSGVHAKKIFAHFDLDSDIPQNLVYRLNSFLPNDIAAKNVFKVTNDAHARFDATSEPTSTSFRWKKIRSGMIFRGKSSIVRSIWRE